MTYSAIVTGATGKIATNLLEKLKLLKINTLAITRNPEKTIRGIPTLGINLLNKPTNLIANWANNNKDNDIYFFHCAWSGEGSLTSGNIGSQLKNIEILSNAIKIAKEAGCSKFINIGSTEELITKYDLENWLNKPALLKPYGLSKLTSYYYSQILTYLNKIDFIQIRFSAAVNSLSRGFEDRGFIYKNVKKLREGQVIEKISNQQLFDFIETSHLASLILETSIVGENKEEYYLGPNYPLKLEEFFELIRIEIKGGKPLEYSNNCSQNYFDNSKYFSKFGKAIDFNIKSFI